MSAPIPGQTWKHDGIIPRALLAEETKAGDDVAVLRIHHWLTNDGLRISLNAEQLDEIGDSLKASAALMRGAEVNQ